MKNIIKVLLIFVALIFVGCSKTGSDANIDKINDKKDIIEILEKSQKSVKDKKSVKFSLELNLDVVIPTGDGKKEKNNFKQKSITEIDENLNAYISTNIEGIKKLEVYAIKNKDGHYDVYDNTTGKFVKSNLDVLPEKTTGTLNEIIKIFKEADDIKAELSKDKKSYKIYMKAPFEKFAKQLKEQQFTNMFKDAYFDAELYIDTKTYDIIKEDVKINLNGDKDSKDNKSMFAFENFSLTIGEIEYNTVKPIKLPQ